MLKLYLKTLWLNTKLCLQILWLVIKILLVQIYVAYKEFNTARAEYKTKKSFPDT